MYSGFFKNRGKLGILSQVSDIGSGLEPGKGYFNAGVAIDSLQFSDETVKNTFSSLSVSKTGRGGINSSADGYWGGGYSKTDIIDKINFQTENTSVSGAVLSTARYNLGGTNSSTNGFFSGGVITLVTNIIDKFVFSTENCSALVATLVESKSFFISANSSSKGYCISGHVGDGAVSGTKTIDYIDFSTEAAGELGASWEIVQARAAGVNSATKAYGGGGINFSLPHISLIKGLKFSDETLENPSSSLSVGRFQLGGINSSVKGYWAGGYVSSATNVIDYINFSNETTIILNNTLSANSSNITGINTGNIL